MARIEPRVNRLEAKVRTSDRTVKVGEFGYATVSEIRELLATIAAKGPAFEVNRHIENQINQHGAALRHPQVNELASAQEELKNGKP